MRSKNSQNFNFDDINIESNSRNKEYNFYLLNVIKFSMYWKI